MNTVVLMAEAQNMRVQGTRRKRVPVTCAVLCLINNRVKMDPLVKIIIIYLVHVGLIKLYFIICHKIRGKINNPYHEAIAVAVSSFMLSLVTTNIFLVGEEKYGLIFYIPLLFVGLIAGGAAVAKIYSDQHIINEKSTEHANPADR
jgi:hypothetical protein